jgi:hypothetical protein
VQATTDSSLSPDSIKRRRLDAASTTSTATPLTSPSVGTLEFPRFPADAPMILGGDAGFGLSSPPAFGLFDAAVTPPLAAESPAGARPKRVIKASKRLSDDGSDDEYDPTDESGDAKSGAGAGKGTDSELDDLPSDEESEDLPEPANDTSEESGSERKTKRPASAKRSRASHGSKPKRNSGLSIKRLRVVRASSSLTPSLA